ncbi:MAG: Cys-tRNA(Pro) deacylase [Myxococcota bacterium]
MAKAVKTNAARQLDQLKIPYRVVAYDIDPADLSAGAAAQKLGRPVEEVFKTLVAVGDRNGPCFAVLAGPDELDLKALARCTQDRRIALAPLKDVQRLTGYHRGGVSVFGAKKPLPVFVDAAIETHPEISVSAGQRGLQLYMRPEHFIRASQATVAKIARTNDE